MSDHTAGSMRRIAHQQLRLMGRDHRLRWLALALVFLAAASLAAGWSGGRAQVAERQDAASLDRQIWDGLGRVNPHGAAHTGRSVFAPVSPLAAFDPGVTRFLGTSVRLEGHGQNPSRDRPMEGGAAISRFTGFSPAWALQVAAPLLIILAGFASFAGERPRERLTQELASGASATALVFGRLAGLSMAAMLVLAVCLAAGLTALMLAGEGLAQGAGLMAMGFGYGLYLLIFASLTIAVSALSSSARTALVTLLALWATTTLLAPRLAPAVAEQIHPTPVYVAFERGVSEEIKTGVSGHDPADARLDALKARLLQHYGVASVEQLPFNFSGVALEFGEANASETYTRHYERLHAVYRQQDDVGRLFGLLSPTVALVPWSRAFAATDFSAHASFLKEAEAYRYALIQTLNRDVARNKPQTDEIYRTDVGALTARLRFEPTLPRPAEAWAAQRANLLILAIWAVFSLGLCGLAAGRLGRAA